MGAAPSWTGLPRALRAPRPEIEIVDEPRPAEADRADEEGAAPLHAPDRLEADGIHQGQIVDAVGMRLAPERGANARQDGTRLGHARPRERPALAHRPDQAGRPGPLRRSQIRVTGGQRQTVPLPDGGSDRDP